MKKHLFFLWWMLLSLQAHAAVIYQSTGYGKATPSNFAISFCSGCSFASNSLIGEQFSLTQDALIKQLDFDVTSDKSGTDDLTIAFYASDKQVYAQTFSAANQLKSKTSTLSLTENISVFFDPFKLAAGDYSVFFFGTNLAIKAIEDVGASQIQVNTTKSIPFANPVATSYGSAIRLSGEVISPVPEISTCFMLLLGFVTVFVVRRRHR